MDTYLLPLTDLRLPDRDRAGGKAATLGTLQAAGFRTPGGFCVLADAFRLAIAPMMVDLRAALDTRRYSAPERSARIEQFLNNITIPSPVWDRVQESLRAYPAETPLAVRSSAVLEDMPNTSFAGQYDSILGARGEMALREAILHCWKSYFNESALVERARQPVGEDFGMAVLVQPLIQAECSGVTFSLDPVRPESQRVVVNAIWGLGTGIVDGTTAADTWWVSRRWQVIEDRREAQKHGQSLREGQDQSLVIPKQETAPCLPDAWVERVAQYALAVEALLGCPQDVEWAIDGGGLWLLQSRPIASLKPVNCTPEPFRVNWQGVEDRRLWRLHDIDGQGKRLPLPLERDDFRIVEETRLDTCRMLGADRNMAWLFANGRYYASYEPTGLTEADLRLRRTTYEDLYERLYHQNLTVWDHFGPEIVKTSERLAAFQNQDASTARADWAEEGHRLAEHLEVAIAARRWRHMLHPLIRFKPGRAFFDAFEAISGLRGQVVESAAYRLVISEESVLTRLMNDIYHLSELAREVCGLPALLIEPSPGVMQKIANLPGAEQFTEELQSFMDRYGERNGEGYGSEGSLATPTWRERPEEVLRLAASFLDPAQPSPAARRERARAERDRRLEELLRAGELRAGAKVVDEFVRQLAYAGRLMVSLEEHNHYIDQLAFGQLRRAVLLAGGWLVKQGSLPSTETVFWLTFDEILAGLRSAVPQNFESLTAQRKVEQAAWENLSPPPVLGIPDFQLPPRPDAVRNSVSEEKAAPPEEEADRNVLTGIGASAGTARGRVRLALSPDMLPTITPGDVLVADNAGPLWTPLFALLGALVLDGGSLGQHAASTAREYGLPAVIATRSATRWLADGAWVTVDGTDGVVVLESDG